MRTTTIALLAAAALASASAFGDNTSIDTSFATSGRYNATFAGNTFRALAHLAKPGGGSLAIAQYRTISGSGCPANSDCLGLYNFSSAGVGAAALTVPVSLNFSTTSFLGNLFPTVSGAAIDSQGRIVVVGGIQISGNNYDYRIVRILPTGLADTSFSGDGIADIAFDLGGGNRDIARAVAIDSADRIVVAG
jgi:hypothetical protein